MFSACLNPADFPAAAADGKVVELNGVNGALGMDATNVYYVSCKGGLLEVGSVNKISSVKERLWTGSSGAKRVNDVAVDGTNVYFADTQKLRYVAKERANGDVSIIDGELKAIA